MDERLKELLERMTAAGKFPQISASEAHEVVDAVYKMQEQIEDLEDEIRDLEESYDAMSGN